MSVKSEHNFRAKVLPLVTAAATILTCVSCSCSANLERLFQFVHFQNALRGIKNQTLESFSRNLNVELGHLLPLPLTSVFTLPFGFFIGKSYHKYKIVVVIRFFPISQENGWSRKRVRSSSSSLELSYFHSSPWPCHLQDLWLCYQAPILFSNSQRQWSSQVRYRV